MDAYDAALELLSLVRLCLLQFAVMGAVSALFYTMTPIAAVVYAKLGALENYLPILWRYRQYFAASDITNDFPILFSIALTNIVVQLLFLIIIILRLFQKTSIAPAGQATLKNNALFAILLVASLTPTLELIVGPYDLGSTWQSTGSGPPSVISLYFRYCLIVPAANILLSFLILTRFGPSVVTARRT
jgi:hypothetical protein